jgi:isocitrate dehydrogenase
VNTEYQAVEEKKSLLQTLGIGRASRLNVAFVHAFDPKKSAWSAAHEQGRQHLEKVLGDRLTVNSYVCSPAEAPEVMEGAVKAGAQVIFTTTPPLIDACRMVAAKYPQVETEYMFVDNAAMQMIQNPKRFDVIVTENMFGDILTDEGSVITGSMGLLASASVGEHTSVFEPIHGSYPQAAGKNIANPLATVLSAAMMFEYAFGLKDEGALIREAVEASMKEGVVTEDIVIGNGKAYKTNEVGEWLVGYID